ncbi:MAG: thiamine diphosphokinase [Lachnospiraceae bacterium]|jgi:thiamine pyrophosphokinase
METLLICGGIIEEDFALDFLKKNTWDYVIAVDRGLNFCYEHQLQPDHILGDFDSSDPKILEFYKKQECIPVREYNPVKDYTDTQIGVELACQMGSTRITLLGATGGRLDHFWGNVQVLSIPARAKIPAAIVDAQNYITLLWENTVLEKARQYGKYVSFFPLGDCVENLTLRGFQYPLTNHRMVNTDGLTVSNEIIEEKAYVSFTSGMVIMMMTKDA